MLHVHRSDRADGLVEALRALLAEPPADPFAPELISVPDARDGALAHAADARSALGICANVEFPFPRRLTGDAVAAASGIDPETDPWLPERLVWPLLEIVEEARDEPWLAPHLPSEAGAPVRAPCAISPSLFDRYALHRPELVRWRRATATGRASCGGGCASGSPSPTRRRGWRARARGCAPTPELATCPSACRCSASRGCPPASSSVLRALAEHRDVHLFLLHPSPALWERIAAPARACAGAPSDPTAQLARNRLLASWGQDARELQLVLGPDVRRRTSTRSSTRRARCSRACRPRCARTAAPEPGAGRPQRRGPRLPRPRAPGRGRARRDPAPARRGPDARAARRDRHVPGHRDVRAADPGDVRRGGGRRGRRAARPAAADLRVRLADRSLRQTNPVLGVVARLLELAAQRLTASQVLDLADREPVRRRFRLDDDDARAARGLGADERHPLGAGRRAPRAVQARRRWPPARGASGWTGCCSA